MAAGLMLVAVVMAGVLSGRRLWAAPPATSPPRANPSVSTAPSSPPAGPEIPLPGLYHVHHVTDSIYCGSAPEDAAAFAALRKLGIRTIITVDGMIPDVKLAGRFGLRYVHLPVGYDGINRQRQLEIGRAVRDLPGPFYIHCHHGLHRGPTGAVVAAMTCDGWTRDQAVLALREIGTSSHYSGLYATARDFRKPTKEELDHADASFPSITRPAGLKAAMIQVDKHWDDLKAARGRGWAAAADHPDLEPADEALELRELFREAHRVGGRAAKWPPDLRQRLTAVEQQAAQLEEVLRRGDAHDASTVADALDASCNACHTRYRNVRQHAAAAQRPPTSDPQPR